MSIVQQSNSSIDFTNEKSLLKIISLKIQQKNHSNKKLYSRQVINDIIYNEKSHIVAVFKDFLIYDDTSEFLKRVYKSNETKSRILKILEFYDSYSKIFPNYTVLPEAKYIYKNIQRKQKMIDNIQKKNIGKDEQNSKSKEDRIFETDIYNSIMNLTVSTMKNDDKIINNHQIILNKDRITKMDLNLSINIDDSNISLEGLIENIGKAEESSFKPIKYQENLKKPSINTSDMIQSLLKNNKNTNSQVNMNKFNKKIDFNIKNNNKKQDSSPKIPINKATKETIGNTYSTNLNEKNVFKSIQFNEKLNINFLLDSVNQHPSISIKKKENLVTKSSIIEEKKQPDTERIARMDKEVSHRLTLSIPKNVTNSHIYNNFNIISNFHSPELNNKQLDVPFSQIDVISDLSPKINSARFVQKFEIKKVDKIPKKTEEIIKPKINTSHSVNNINFNKKEEKNSQIVKLRKNYTKTNILKKESDGCTNELNMNNFKGNFLKTSSNQLINSVSNHNTLKLNTIKTSSYLNGNNPINLNKGDRAISLTSRKFISPEPSNQNNKIDDVSSSQNINSPIPLNTNRQLNHINTARLVKNGIMLTNYNMNNISDRKKEVISPKFIKRTKSLTYKTTLKSKPTRSNHLMYDDSKNNISIKKKGEKEKSIEKNIISSSTKQLRVNSTKTSTLSPTKSNPSILTKSTNFKRSENFPSTEKKLFEVTKTSQAGVALFNSRSSKMKYVVDEKNKHSKYIV